MLAQNRENEKKRGNRAAAAEACTYVEFPIHISIELIPSASYFIRIQLKMLWQIKKNTHTKIEEEKQQQQPRNQME